LSADPQELRQDGPVLRAAGNEEVPQELEFHPGAEEPAVAVLREFE